MLNSLLADKTTALVVSSGCQVSHVLPVVNGRLDASNCKRLVCFPLKHKMGLLVP